MLKNVVVTGIGTVNPVGLNVSQTWTSIQNATSGTDRISLFDPKRLKSKVAGEVKNFDPTGIIDSKEIRRLTRFLQFALVAADEAMKHAQLTIDEELAPDAGVLIGTGIGGLPDIEFNVRKNCHDGQLRHSPFFIPMTISNMAAGLISIKYNTKGYNTCVSSACSTANHAIGDAKRMIEMGEAKIMITGGTEAALCETGVGGFDAMRALSTRNDEPKQASRPFDKDRDGFVISEGCGVLILEEEEFAKNRGADILCRLSGYGYSSDANHITAPTVEGPSLSMQKALNNSKLNHQDIDYINAHGTSTQIGDINEIKAIKNIFGSSAKKLAISSSKSMVGHLLGAAGGVEAIFSILAIKNSFIPPTINLVNQDPECDLNVTPNQGQEKQIQHAMSNSFGFGGTNATLIFSKYS